MSMVKADAVNVLERVVIEGDLAKLTPAERIQYYRAVCDSVGLNPLTKPFQYITLNHKLVLYATKDCTDQLRGIHGVSTKITAREFNDNLAVYVVTAQASTAGGRVDESTGAVSTKGLSGENLANALMKAETKAKRRVTLSICGLGFLDETEVVSVPQAQAVPVDMETGEIKRLPAAPPMPKTVRPSPVTNATVVTEPQAVRMVQDAFPEDPEPVGDTPFKRAILQKARQKGVSGGELLELAEAITGGPFDDIDSPEKANAMIQALDD
jgi:hypothetical protein